MNNKIKYTLIIIAAIIIYIFMNLDNTKYQDFPQSKKIVSFIDNKPMDILQKEPVFIVNFFTSWCGACHNYNSNLLTLISKTHVPIYGVSLDNNYAALTKFLVYYGNPYKDIFVDRYHELSRDLDIKSLPQTLLIKKGKVIKRYIGGMSIPDILKISKQ